MKLPNILLIVMDAARADHLSCYGYERLTTPHLDKIAGEGVLYQNAISAAVWTAPSHASLFTGMYLSGHGLYGRQLKLRTDLPTLSGFLGEQGYDTLALTANALIGDATGLSRGFGEIKDIRNIIQGERLSRGRKAINAAYRRLYYGPRPHMQTWYDNGALRLNADMKQWLNRQQNRATKRPFFIFANYMEPHLRYYPPRAFRAKFLTPAQERRWKQVNQNAWKYMSGEVAMTDDDWDILTRLYDAELAYLDRRVGQIYDFLQQNSLLDETILIITSDHGENLGDHNLMDHQYCVYDTLARVPLIIRYPTHFPAGLEENALVQTLDVFPTVVSLLNGNGRSAQQSWQGQSLLPKDLAQSSREFTVTEYLAPQLHSFKRESVTFDSQFTRKLRAIRTATHKYIWASDGNHELYHLETDPGEMNNLIDAEPETAVNLASQLSDWLNQRHIAPQSEPEPIGDILMNRLEALGYI